MVFDVIVRNGRVVDGTGNPAYGADVGVRGGRIEFIGGLGGRRAERVIDAGGLVVSPGFIDIHSHSDVTLVVNGRAESKVRQGVTTEVVGNCGTSAAPMIGKAAEGPRSELGIYGMELDWVTLEDYFGRLVERGVSVNVASLVGHTTLRRAVAGDSESITEQQLGEMKKLTEQAMRGGAIGLSTGLEFAPGGYADTDELVELCRVVARHGGIYVTHQRNRDTHYQQATTEATEIGKRARIPVHLSHFVTRYPGEGQTPRLLWMVDDARKKGLDITFDVITPNEAPQEIRNKLRDGYHWAAANELFNSLVPQLIPPWGLVGGVDEVLGRCRDPVMRRRFREEHVPQWKLFGCPRGRFRILGTEYDFPDGVAPRWSGLLLNSSEASPEMVGMLLDEIAAARGFDDPWDAAMDLVIREIEKTGQPCPLIRLLGATTAEGDSLMALGHPVASVCTDRRSLAPYGALARRRSPNSYGAFARVFRKYVRERRVFTLEEVVRKMTSLAANSLRIRDRGVVREGARADLAVFDPERIADNATIEEPTRYAEGVEYVLVNGEVVIDGGEHTGALPGTIIRNRNTTEKTQN